MKDRDGQGKDTLPGRESARMWSVMYPVHFGMRENPFPTDADTKFLWLGGKRKEALESLVSGILSGEGGQIVTGKPGMGKTLLANAVLDKLGDQVLAAVVPCAEYKGIDFLRLVERAYGISSSVQNQGSFFSRFSEFLHRSHASGKKVVLIVDDAHRLSPPYLQELSELSRIEEGGTRLLSLVFFGEPRLLDQLEADPNPEFSESANRSMVLDPLTREETSGYIQHHLRIAWCEKELFEPGSVDEIFAYSQGVPRLIDKACDSALSRAYYVGEKLVTPSTVKDALDLMSVEKTAFPESVPDLSFEVAAAADRDKDDESDEEDKPGIPAGQVRRQNRRWITASAVLGCLLVALIVIASFVLKGRSPTVPSPSVEVKQAIAPPPSPSTEKAATTPAVTVKSPSLPARQQESVVSAGEEPGRALEVRDERKKSRQAAPKPSVERTRRTAAKSPSREAVPPAGGTPAGDAGREPSADRAGTTSQEPSTQKAEQVESGEVIDWMLKRRAGQK